MEEKKHSRIDVWGKGVTLVRETVLILLVILLLLWPRGINNILTSAGFTEASIAGLTWEAVEESTEQTGNALETIEQLKGQLAEVKAKLTEVMKEAPEPVRKDVSSALANVQAIEDSAGVVNKSLQQSHATGQLLLRSFRPNSELRRIAPQTD